MNAVLFNLCPVLLLLQSKFIFFTILQWSYLLHRIHKLYKRQCSRALYESLVRHASITIINHYFNAWKNPSESVKNRFHCAQVYLEGKYCKDLQSSSIYLVSLSSCSCTAINWVQLRFCCANCCALYHETDNSGNSTSLISDSHYC